jgi:hypothetical protein
LQRDAMNLVLCEVWNSAVNRSRSIVNAIVSTVCRF